MDALKFFDRGTKYISESNFNMAVSEFSEAVKFFPEMPLFYGGLGYALVRLYRFQEAVKAFDRAIELMPDEPSYFSEKGTALLGLNCYSDAFDAYDRAAKLDPLDPKHHDDRGNMLRFLDRNLEAIDAFDAAIELNGDNPHYHCHRGIALYNLNRCLEALESHNRAIKLNDNDAVFYNEHGNTLLGLHRNSDALDSYTRASELNPARSIYHLGRGNALVAMGYPAEALNAFDRALQLDPNEPNSLNGRGNALYDLHRFQEALHAFGRAIKLNPANPLYLLGRGNALVSLKRPLEALNAFDEAIELDPNDAKYHYGRGSSLSDLHRYQEALRAYNRAIELDDEIPNFHNGKGNVLLKLNRYREALNAYERAIELDPNNPMYPYGKGNALVGLKRYVEAVEAFDRVIELDDSFDLAYYRKGDTCVLLYNYAVAQANYVRYIFLEEVYPSEYFNLLDFFRDHGDAPFVVKRLLGRDLIYYYLESYRGFLQLVDTQCRPIQDCLDWGAMQGWSTLQPINFLRFELLCHYFMGDTAEAYSIFDNQLDNDPTYQLSLMDHYYYVCSGIYSARPDFSLEFVRQEALSAARATANKLEEVPIQRYYAGLILYSFGKTSDDLAVAERCFLGSRILLAAKYMLWKIAGPHERTARRQEILEHESRLPPEKSFANGINPRTISRTFKDYSEAMQHYCFYYELLEAIQEVHPANKPIEIVPFYQYWQFVLSSEQMEGMQKELSEQELLTQFRNTRIAEKAYHELGRLLESMRIFLDTEKIEENFRGQLGDLFFELKQLREQADLDTLAQRPGGIEDLLASQIWKTAKFKIYQKYNIRGLHYWEVHQQFILYFLGRGQVDVRQAIRLIMYAGYAGAEDNLFSRVRLAASLDGSGDLLKAVPEVDSVKRMLNEIKDSEKMQDVGKVLASAIGTAMIPIGTTLGGTFLLGFMVKSLLSIVEEKFIVEKEKVGYKEDYSNFLKDLNVRIAAAYREGIMDPTVEKILGLT